MLKQHNKLFMLQGIEVLFPHIHTCACSLQKLHKDHFHVDCKLTGVESSGFIHSFNSIFFFGLLEASHMLQCKANDIGSMSSITSQTTDICHQKGLNKSSEMGFYGFARLIQRQILGYHRFDLILGAMDLQSAAEAFTKFEGQCLTELLSEDVELEATHFWSFLFWLLEFVESC